MKPVKFHPLAESEMIDSAAFYEHRRPHLGDNFLDSIEETLGYVRANAEMGMSGKFATRSWKVRRFPFRIVYLLFADRIWIVAVAHLSRKPDYWAPRIDTSM